MCSCRDMRFYVIWRKIAYLYNSTCHHFSIWLNFSIYNVSFLKYTFVISITRLFSEWQLPEVVLTQFVSPDGEHDVVETCRELK
jgi:hypothetical protein